MEQEPPSLSVIVPIYNEGEILAHTLPEFYRWLSDYGAKCELILVTDGSGQTTVQFVADFVSRYSRGTVQTTWLSHPSNRGKGAALRSGAWRGSGNIIAFVDADGSLPIEEMSRLLEAINEGADVAIASRRAEGAHPRVTSPWMLRSLPGWLLNRAAQRFFTPGITDTQCGMKAYRRRVLQKILARAQIDRFAFDIEWLTIALREGFIVREVGIRWIPRRDSSVSILRDGIRAIRDLLALKKRLSR